MLRFSLLLLVAVCVASAQIKVAIINSQASVIETAEIKKAQAELEAKYKPRQAQMEKLQKELADLQNQLQSGQGKLTPQAEQNLQITGQRKQRELQRLTEDLICRVTLIVSATKFSSALVDACRRWLGKWLKSAAWTSLSTFPTRSTTSRPLISRRKQRRLTTKPIL
jgi:TolA-binding protein